MEYTTINHDAFARVETIRVKVTRKCECSECGQPAKWYYGHHADGYGARPNIDYRHPFCSIGCARSYNL